MSFVECKNSNDVCYTVWRTDQNGTDVIEIQGCWTNSENEESCLQEQCVSDKPQRASYTHRFCCCSGKMCNTNITVEIPPEIPDATLATAATHPSYEPMTISMILFWMLLVLIALTMIYLLSVGFISMAFKKREPEMAPLTPSGPGYSSNLQNVDNLKLVAMIGQGKYGTVWKGQVNEQSVAVKIYPAQHRQYFLNEKDIYSLPMMDSPTLLEYYGCDERRTLDDSIEYLLVLSLAPFGCLQDWLRENTSSFSVFTAMAKSVARGLSHLHTEMKRGDLKKACVCHRDLNSRNILVKADLTCCVADFGFALKTLGPRYEWRGEIAVAETKSINEVGTLRYLAPEVS